MFKGTRKEGNDQPHERDRNTPNASATKGTPRPLTLEQAKDSMSIVAKG